MCGFVGYLSTAEPLQLDLDAWSDVIRHRGPDQTGHAVDGSFGVGTRRLSILDLSDAGSQPMHNERYVLGFNGEIYNHLELRAELKSEGPVAFSSHSDTETVLKAIERWGVSDALSRLNGMYALAVWDKVSQEVTIARDPLGVKPVYYVRTSDALLFASELRALRPYTSGKIAAEGSALYLYLGFVPAPFSLLEGVEKVRPGSAITFSQSGRREQRIIPRAWKRPTPLARDPKDRVLQVRNEVEAAVQRQLISDVPIGVYLSGGVDSTVIASVAASAHPGLSSFSLNPEDTTLDPTAATDAKLASQFARQLGLTHHDVAFSPDDVVSELDHFLVQIDEPVAELYAAAEILLSRTARAEGVKVVLTGHGGDEVFLGYPTYDAVFRGDLLNMVPMLGPALRLASQSPWFSPDSRQNLLGAASIWRQSVLDRYAIVSGVHFSIEEVSGLTGLPCDRVRGLVQEVVTDTSETARQLPRGESLRNAERFARMDMLLMVPEHYNTRLDRTTMGASVEARVPLQDLELIGFVMQLSHKDLLRGGLKGMLRSAFADILPQEVVQRQKQTFQAPMLSWITGPLAPWVADRVATAPGRSDVQARTITASPASTRAAYQSWSLALIEGWRDALDLTY